MATKGSMWREVERFSQTAHMVNSVASEQGWMGKWRMPWEWVRLRASGRMAQPWEAARRVRSESKPRTRRTGPWVRWKCSKIWRD